MIKNLILIALILGLGYSTTSVSITTPVDECTGEITVVDGSGTAGQWAYKVQGADDSTYTDITGQTTLVLDLSTMTNGGSYTFRLTITSGDSPSITQDAVIYNCSEDPTITETNPPSGCTGTLTGAEFTGFTSTSKQWYYQSTASGSSQQTGPADDVFDLSEIALNGTYDLWIVYSKTGASQTAYYKGVELSGCPPSVEISAGTAVSGCTGTFTVAATNFTPTTYAWTYTSSASGATPQTSTQNTATFDVSKITVSDTYTLGVTVTDGVTDGVSETATLTTGALTGCESGSSSDDDTADDDTAADDDAADDDDDDSANILSVLAIFLLALVL